MAKLASSSAKAAMRFIWAGIWWALATSLVFAGEIKVCDSLVVYSDEPISFTVTERRLLCGDDKNPPWANPSESQVKVFLTAFLQTRGFFQPLFSRDGKILVVDVGLRSRIAILNARGAPPELKITNFWVPERKTLTPALLDEYQDLVQGRIESKGYPCPKVSATANAAENSMLLEVEAGPRQRVVDIKEEKIGGLRPHTLRRYFPIDVGDWFNGDLVQLANERIKTEDILAGSYMVSSCGQDGAVIEHRAVIGPPRSMTVGFGVNTETYFLVRSTYRNAHVDDNASRFDAIFLATYFNQHIQSSFDWYFLPWPTSIHFKPTVTHERHAEEKVETRTTKGIWHLGAYGDFRRHYWRVYAGPSLNLVNTLRGVGPGFARILELEANGRIMSHDFEFYRTAPRSGYLIDWRLSTASRRTLSTLTAKTLSADWQALVNWAGKEPPLVVLGARGGVATTIADPQVDLPEQYRYYLGGSRDVRGFKRHTIPGKNSGARSLATAGVEVRVVTVFPYNLQPFVFIDGGQLGSAEFTLDPPLFYSPGLGLRWQSPFGPLRGSIARGYIAREDQARSGAVTEGLTAFVSFGEEF